MKPYYQDDAVTIYHGDCRDLRCHFPEVHLEVDLLLTDPPYGIGFAAQPTDYQRFNGMKPSSWDDEKPNAETIAYIRSFARDQVIWGGNYFANHLPPSRGWLSWVKPDAPPSMGNVELAWTSRDMNAKHFSWSIAATNGERVGHPTQKPLAVMTWALSFFPNAQTILDHFMGSGTTLRAAKDLGRKAIGIEIEERYCEIAAKRMAQEVFTFA